MAYILGWDGEPVIVVAVKEAPGQPVQYEPGDSPAGGKVGAVGLFGGSR
jgi:hypothetical protein